MVEDDEVVGRLQSALSAEVGVVEEESLEVALLRLISEDTKESQNGALPKKQPRVVQGSF